VLNVTLDETIFGVESLTGLVRSFMEEPGSRVCQDLFRRGRVLAPEGSTAAWEESQLSRHLAPITGRDAPHVNVAPTTVIPRASAMAHVKIYKDLPAGTLLDRRAPGSMSADERIVLNEALEDLAKLIKNTLERMCAQLLATGSITVTTALFPGSQVTFTVLFTGFNTYVVGANWNVVGTKIVSSELVALERSFRAASAKELGTIVMNAGVKGYLVQNTEITNFAQYTLGGAVLASGPINLGNALPQLMIGGYQWKQADGVFVPQGGAATRYFADNKIAALPPENQLRDTLALAEGYGYVPRASLVASPGTGGIEKAPQRGAYAYAAVNPDVPSVRLYAGWVGLPILLTPQDLTVSTVA
jgi:hypothetical protein